MDNFNVIQDGHFRGGPRMGIIKRVIFLIMSGKMVTPDFFKLTVF